LRPPFDLRPPKSPHWPWVAIGVSLAVHAFLLLGWVGGRLPSVPRLPRQLIVLSPPEGSPEVSMPYQPPRAEVQPSRRAPSDIRRRNSTRRSAPTATARPPQTVAAIPERKPPPIAADTGSTARSQPRAQLGRIGPGLADGKLWVRPLPLPPRELAQRLSGNQAQLVDSAVTAIVQAYLDSIADDPTSRPVGPPSWTTEIAGKKFGLDSKNIYIAGLKIPTVVLSLLSISLPANIDQNRAYNQYMDLRADMLYAAQRAQTLEEFKEVIREIRARKEREREFEKNQRTAPPPKEPPVQ
jgi:hypothetical protein